jgi:aminoglycoside phosphotransferase (APT) family kinase protein
VGSAGHDGPAGLPEDAALRALRAAAEHGLDATLRRAGLVPPFEEVTVLRYHAGRRCTFAVRAGGRHLIAKAYRHDPAPVARVLSVLEHHALAGRPPPSAPRLVAYEPELRLLVTERLEGVIGRDLLARGPRAGELAAQWLHRQSALPFPEGRPYGPGELLRRFRAAAGEIHAAAPDLGASAAALIGELEKRLPAERAFVLSHGSFSINHIADLGEGPGVIDWDAVGQGPFEFDAANFLSTLARAGTAGPAVARRAAEAEQAFRDRIAGVVDPSALAWHEAATLVRSARHLCVRRPEAWRARASELLALASARRRASG